jgi:hypothetical protein
LKVATDLVLLCSVSQFLGVNRSSESSVSFIVLVRVVWWVGDNFVWWAMLVFKEFLQSDDSRQDEGDLSDNQSPSQCNYVFSNCQSVSFEQLTSMRSKRAHRLQVATKQRLSIWREGGVGGDISFPSFLFRVLKHRKVFN